MSNQSKCSANKTKLIDENEKKREEKNLGH